MSIAIRNHQHNPPQAWDLDVGGMNFHISATSYPAQAEQVREIQIANNTYTGEPDLYAMLNTKWCQLRPTLCMPEGRRGAIQVVRSDAQAPKRKTRTGGCSACGGGRVR